MTPFEYVSVLISIILGLGITQIMTGVADLVHQWEKVKLYWPHLVWILLVFVLHIQEWWITYLDLQGFTLWRLPTFLFFILYPVNLFILARILFPTSPSNDTIDLKVFYYGNFRKFFLCTMILNVLSITGNIIVEGWNSSQLIIVGLFIIVGWIAWKKYTMEWLHKTVAVGLLFVLVIGIIINWNNWTIR